MARGPPKSNDPVTGPRGYFGPMARPSRVIVGEKMRGRYPAHDSMLIWELRGDVFRRIQRPDPIWRQSINHNDIVHLDEGSFAVIAWTAGPEYIGGTQSVKIVDTLDLIAVLSRDELLDKLITDVDRENDVADQLELIAEISNMEPPDEDDLGPAGDSLLPDEG